MRLITVAVLALALPGCAHHRHRPAADGDQAAAAPAKADKTTKAPPLPDGLVGDGEQHSYVEPPPRSS